MSINKEKEWWKPYLTKDKNIVRPLDGYEYFLTISFLSVSDIFPYFTIDEFITTASKNLKNISIFNYTLKYIENYPFWYKKEFKLSKNENIFEHIKNDETYNDYIKKEKKVFFDKEYNDKEDNSLKYTFKFEITQLKNNKTQLILYAMHTMCDGRTIFNIFDYVRKIIDNIVNKKDDLIKEELPLDEICDFGQFNNYKNLDKNLYEQPPKKWSEIPFINILPKINNNIKNDYFYINKHFIYDYKPIQNFCKSNNVSVQSMITTMIARATRKFNKLNDDIPIYNYTPCDSRKNNLATEKFRHQKFFCVSGALFPFSLRKNNVLEEIKFNYNNLHTEIKNNGNIAQILRSSMTINKDNLTFTPEEKMPDFNKQACTCSSHIGKINGNSPLFGLHLNIDKSNPDNYVLAFYCYHTEDILAITCLKPNGFNDEFMEIIENEINNIFNLEF